MKKVVKMAKATKAQRYEALVREAMFAAFKEATRKCMQKFRANLDEGCAVAVGSGNIGSKRTNLFEGYYNVLVTCVADSEVCEQYQLEYKVQLEFVAICGNISRTANGRDEIVNYNLAYYSFDEIAKLITDKLIEIKADIR